MSAKMPSTPESTASLPNVPVNENTERIFREAWAMFQHLGFRGTSVDELCLRCGLTKPTLYYYFGNKETLFIQVMLRQLQGWRSILEANQPLTMRLTELARAMLAEFTTDIGSMMRDMEHVKDQALHQRMQTAFREQLFDPLVRAMSGGIQDETLRPGDAEFFAWIFLGLINTFVRSRTRPARPGFAGSPELLAPQLVDFFFQGAYHPMQREE